MAEWILNTKTGTVHPNGPNFSKMKGLIVISEADAMKVLKKQVNPNSIAGASMDAAAIVAKNKAIENAKRKAGIIDDSQEVPEDPIKDVNKEPEKTTVSIDIPPEAVQKIAEEAAEEAKKEDVGKSDKFGSLSRDTVTVADVAALPDEDVAVFANTVLKVTCPTDRPAAESREFLMKIVGKLEAKRNKSK